MWGVERAGGGVDVRQQEDEAGEDEEYSVEESKVMLRGSSGAHVFRDVDLYRAPAPASHLLLPLPMTPGGNALLLSPIIICQSSSN